MIQEVPHQNTILAENVSRRNAPTRRQGGRRRRTLLPNVGGSSSNVAQPTEPQASTPYL